LFEKIYKERRILNDGRKEEEEGCMWEWHMMMASSKEKVDALLLFSRVSFHLV
jgi:hypothetical protein